MSLMNLFRSKPVPKPVAKHSPASPPIDLLQEKLRAEQLAALRTTIEAEAISIGALPEVYQLPRGARNFEQVQQDLEMTGAERLLMFERYRAALSKLLPVEQTLREKMLEECYSLDAAYRKRLSSLVLELNAARADKLYKRIDIAFMGRRKWSAKHACAMPLFALFHVDQSVCALGGHARMDHGYPLRTFPIVEPCILGQYFAEFTNKMQEDCARELGPRAQPSNGVRARRIAARFVGAIPEQVRASVREARPLFEQIYIVTESPEWEIEFFETGTGPLVYRWLLQPLPIPLCSPLVIGQKDGKFWLIAEFDTAAV